MEVLLFQAAIIAVVYGLYSWLGRDWALGVTLLMTVGSLFLLFEPALTAVTMATAWGTFYVGGRLLGQVAPAEMAPETKTAIKRWALIAVKVVVGLFAMWLLLGGTIYLIQDGKFLIGDICIGPQCNR